MTRPQETTTPGFAWSRRVVLVVLAFMSITAVHALVARESHALHVVHVAFGALYLVPCVAAAVWISPTAGLLAAAGAAAAYLGHATIRLDDPMEPAQRFIMAMVYLFVGSTSAWLVHQADRERRRHAEEELRAERETVVQSISSLSRALRSRDDDTGDHSERVARIAAAIATRLGLPQARADTLRLAGLVHDVGKIGVRDDVLMKPGALSPEERAAIERHPAIAAEILAPLRGCRNVAALVVAHHEAPDGSGYPAGLAGDQIPRDAGILRVADVYAALTESRPYREPMTPRQAIEAMHRWEGKLDLSALVALESVVGPSGP